MPDPPEDRFDATPGSDAHGHARALRDWGACHGLSDGAALKAIPLTLQGSARGRWDLAVRERPVRSFAEGLALFVAVFANANDEIDARRELSALRQQGATSTVDLCTAAFLALVQRIRTDPPKMR